MSQRFNNGRGAYTCDECEKILWTGHDGVLYPSNRNYVLPETSLYRLHEFFFCSKKCKDNFETPVKEPKKRIY